MCQQNIPLHPLEYTFYSVTWKDFSKITNILEHKRNLTKFKKTYMTPIILSYLNIMKQSTTLKKKHILNTTLESKNN